MMLKIFRKISISTLALAMIFQGAILPAEAAGNNPLIIPGHSHFHGGNHGGRFQGGGFNRGGHGGGGYYGGGYYGGGDYYDGDQFDGAALGLAFGMIPSLLGGVHGYSHCRLHRVHIRTASGLHWVNRRRCS